MTKFIIKCKSRGLFFLAIHGSTPMYGPAEKAKTFGTFAEAFNYANTKLFTTHAAFVVELAPDALREYAPRPLAVELSCPLCGNLEPLQPEPHSHKFVVGRRGLIR